MSDQLPEPTSKPAEVKQATDESRLRRVGIWVEWTAKLSVLAVFLLYSIGFVIWHAHLAAYGVSQTEFLQSEYFAAALCYLVYVASLAVPAGWLFHSFLKPKPKKTAGHEFPWVMMISIWGFVLLRISSLYFSESPSLQRHWYKEPLSWLMVVVLAHIALVLLFRGRTRFARLHGFLAKWDWIAVYGFAVYVSILLQKQDVQISFLFLTIFMYPTVFYIAGYHLRDVWRQQSLVIRATAGIAVILFFVGHIRDFGAVQFKHIPRSVGGGKAELALLHIVPGYSFRLDNFGMPISKIIFTQTNSPALAPTNSITVSTNALAGTNLNSQAWTNLPAVISATNSFVGPVAILLRSKDEVIFVLPAEIRSGVAPGARRIAANTIDFIQFQK